MERLLRILSLALVVMLGGCTAMMESSTYGTGDLYITDNRIKVAEELKVRAEAEKAQAEARKAMWEARMAEAEYYAASGENYNTIVADDYESAYARRLYGFNSPTYRLPSSYYALATSDAMRYATAYDPAYYNIMVSGDQVWVEPKYVTSMFGAWGATNVTFGIYTSPWAYGWGVYASPFYYTMWGYPHYSWYDWNWNICYNPYHWGYYPGYYPGYYHPHYGYPHYGYPHYGHNPQPPHYNNKPGGGNVGMGGSFAKNERRHSASRYTSPTSNQNYGKNLNGSRVGQTIRNSGSTSSGVNHSTVNRGSSTTPPRSNTRYSTSTSTTTPKRSEQSSNFRSSSSSSSSSSRSSSSSSSSSYRSSSSSSSSSRSSGGTTSSRR